jgi:hypothetical protein
VTRWYLALVLVAACGTRRDSTHDTAITAQHRDAIAWQEPIDLATGGGEKGPWQQNNSRFDYVDDGTVAIAEDGSAVVAWVDHRRKDIFVKRDGRKPVNVSNTPAVFSWLPRIAVAGQDVFVVWQEIVFSGGTHGGDIFFARSRDGGLTFEQATNLSESIHGDGKGRISKDRWHNGSLDMALGADGAIYIAWTAYEGQLWLRRSRDRGETFDRAIVVDDGTAAPARAPSLAIGDAVYLAWTVGENDAADVRVARSRDGKTFSEPAIVERTAHYSDAPKLALAGGMLHLAISETIGGPFGRPTVRYTRSRDGGATFEPARVISGREGGGFPSLAVDGERVVVAWERFADDTPRGLAMALSRDGGTTFTAPAPIPGTHDRGANGSQQGKLASKLAVRGDVIAVANSALRHGESSRVWLVRGRDYAFR